MWSSPPSPSPSIVKAVTEHATSGNITARVTAPTGSTLNYLTEHTYTHLDGNVSGVITFGTEDLCKQCQLNYEHKYAFSGIYSGHPVSGTYDYVIPGPKPFDNCLTRCTQGYGKLLEKEADLVEVVTSPSTHFYGVGQYYQDLVRSSKQAIIPSDSYGPNIYSLVLEFCICRHIPRKSF